jgi:hypothetical protein
MISNVANTSTMPDQQGQCNRKEKHGTARRSGHKHLGDSMRRSSTALVLSLALMVVFASQATASTAQLVSMTFAEPIHPSVTCAGFPDVSCGSGEIRPLGPATETVTFGAGCGGTCDLRTITLAGGSIIADETVTDPTCPAGDVCRPGPLEVGSASLTDTIIGGTGLYAGASGALTGTVRVEASNLRPAGTSTVKLSGTIHYA